MLFSVVFHVVLVVVLVRMAMKEASERGNPLLDMNQAPGGGGGGGSGGTGFIAITPPPPPPPSPEVAPPVVVPTVIPEIETTPVQETPVPPPPAPSPASGTVANAGTGTGTGGGQGTGTGPGTGSGVGPGSGSGTGGGTGGGGREGTPPEARQVILPPLDIPRSLRGHTVEVSFRIGVDGRVTDFDVVPPITDRKFAQKFDEVMRGYRFRPARDAAGQLVPGVLTVVVTFSESR